MQKIIFIKRSNSSFILTDQKILESAFLVKPFLIGEVSTKKKLFRKLIELTFFLIFRSYKTSFFITWFSDYHAAIMVFIGKILRKKTVIFAGGQEAISYPELSKGAYRTKFRGGIVAWALCHASIIIPNHKSLIFHENTFFTDIIKKDGIRYYNPGIKTKIEVIPNGFDINKFRRDYSIQKKPGLILTAGKTNIIEDIIVKGFDLFVQVAAKNPDLEFVILAIKESHIQWLEEKYSVSSIKNLTFKPYFCSEEDMHFYYNSATVFVQNSITEGMPNTLGEAMLCECIPVGSNVNGIPDLIGGTGVLLYKRTFDELERAIRQALTMDTGATAREHVVRNFSYMQRAKHLIKLLHTFSKN